MYDAEGLPLNNINGEPERRLSRRRGAEYYLLSTIPPGTYRMELRLPDGRLLTEEFEIYPGEETELVFQ